MKLKYYLRGMGIGIILTAIVMGFALGGRKATISDAEIIERAKALGMVDASGVLSQTVEPSENKPVVSGSEEISDDSSTSLTSLDEKGKEISEKDDQTVALASEPVSEVAEEKKTGKEKKTEDNKSSDNANKQDSSSEASTASTKEEVKPAEEVKKEETKQEEQKTQEVKTEEEKPAESALGSTTSVTKTVTIPGGMGSEQVAALLQREGVIDSASSFNQYLCEKKMDRYIRSGVKTFPAGSTYEDIARIICRG